MSSFSKKTTNIFLHNKQNKIIQTNTLIKKRVLDYDKWRIIQEYLEDAMNKFNMLGEAYSKHIFRPSTTLLTLGLALI